MQIRYDQLIRSISAGLDFVEGELLGATSNHGKRTAVLCAAMGRRLGFTDRQVGAVACCALLHDNALTEYIQAEHAAKSQGEHCGLDAHCEIGQRNVDYLVHDAAVSGFILYHHERADGLGPFGKKEGEFPLGTALIAAADGLDVRHPLQRLGEADLPALRAQVRAEIGERLTAEAGEALLAVLDSGLLASLKDDCIAATAEQALPPWKVEMDGRAMMCLAEFASRMIDYKSAFTRRHSAGIAGRAWYLADWYGFDEHQRAYFYLAAALHDVGKLATPQAILEKEGPLSDDEFAVIKQHVLHTWEMLSAVEGFDAICRWASSHHEKLDGSGYPFGKKAGDLDFNSRLLACIDIYQAVSEERPYHPKRSHADTMAILFDMAEKGFIDSNITADLDKALAGYPETHDGPRAWLRSLIAQDEPCFQAVSSIF